LTEVKALQGARSKAEAAKMKNTTRTAVITAAIIFSITCMGAGPFSLTGPSKKDLADRIQELEKQNGELKDQVRDMETKLELLSQRVNASCGNHSQGTFRGGESISSSPPPSVPGLSTVRLSPGSTGPVKPRKKGSLIITSSKDEKVLVEGNGKELPNTGYMPLPDPEETPYSEEVAERARSSSTAAMASLPSQPSGQEPRSEAESFEKINEMVKQGNASDAKSAMTGYLQSYPKGLHVDEVAYWLGEARFNDGEYGEAIKAFRIVTESHPESSLAPQALYKSGLSYLEIGRTEEAGDALREVKILYPFSDAAGLAEDKLAACCR